MLVGVALTNIDSICNIIVFSAKAFKLIYFCGVVVDKYVTVERLLEFERPLSGPFDERGVFINRLKERRIVVCNLDIAGSGKRIEIDQAERLILQRGRIPILT